MNDLQRKSYLELLAEVEKQMSSQTPLKQEMYFYKKVIKRRGWGVISDLKSLPEYGIHPVTCDVIERVDGINRDIAPMAHRQVVDLIRDNVNFFNEFRASSPESIGKEGYEKMIKVIDDIRLAAHECEV